MVISGNDVYGCLKVEDCVVVSLMKCARRCNDVLDQIAVYGTFNQKELR